jgi:hypothetical protein
VPIDLITVQSLAALVAVVSVSIIGIVVLLIRGVWEGLENTSVGLVGRQRRLTYLIPFITGAIIFIYFFLFDIVAIYIPNWTQVAMRVMALLIILGSIIFSGVYIIQHRHNNTKIAPSTLPFLYGFAFVFLVLTLIYSLFSLLCVGPTMLNIEVGPFSFENYYWGRYALFHGISTFIFGIGSLALPPAFLRIRGQKQNKQLPNRKRSIITFSILLALSAVLLGIIMWSSLESVGAKRFIQGFLNWPLEVQSVVSDNGSDIWVSNKGDFDWIDVTISINEIGLSSGYTMDLPIVKEGNVISIPLSEFCTIDGTRFNSITMKVARVKIKINNNLGQTGTEVFIPNIRKY